MNSLSDPRFSQTIFYGGLLAENYAILYALHHDQVFNKKYIDALYPRRSHYTALPHDPANEITLNELRTQPYYAESYRVAITESYGLSPVQQAMTANRLAITNVTSPYQLHNDRTINILSGFKAIWNERDQDDSSLFTIPELPQLAHSTSHISPYPVTMDDGEVYHECGYNSLIIGAFALRWHINMIEDGLITIDPDAKNAVTDGLRAQEQLVLNCANLHYLFYENWAKEAQVTIEKPVIPEFPPTYPAVMP